MRVAVGRLNLTQHYRRRLERGIETNRLPLAGEPFANRLGSIDLTNFQQHTIVQFVPARLQHEVRHGFAGVTCWLVGGFGHVDREPVGLNVSNAWDCRLWIKTRSRLDKHNRVRIGAIEVHRLSNVIDARQSANLANLSQGGNCCEGSFAANGQVTHRFGRVDRLTVKRQVLLNFQLHATGCRIQITYMRRVGTVVSGKRTEQVGKFGKCRAILKVVGDIGNTVVGNACLVFHPVPKTKARLDGKITNRLLDAGGRCRFLLLQCQDHRGGRRRKIACLEIVRAVGSLDLAQNGRDTIKGSAKVHHFPGVGKLVANAGCCVNKSHVDSCSVKQQVGARLEHDIGHRFCGVGAIAGRGLCQLHRKTVRLNITDPYDGSLALVGGGRLGKHHRVLESAA